MRTRRSIRAIALLIALCAPAGAATITWTGGAGDGQWGSAANWDLARVPQAGDDVVIAQAGAFTVTCTTAVTVNSIALGGASGAPSLRITTGLTLSGPADSVIGTTGTLTLDSGVTIGGAGRIVNQGYVGAGIATISLDFENAGYLRVTGNLAILAGFHNSTGASVYIQCNCPFNSVAAQVTTGFTNDGTIYLDGSGSMYGAGLVVDAGTLVNSATGEIRSLGGNNLGAFLTAELDNRGEVNIQDNHGLRLDKSGAHHVNTGAIRLDTGDFSISQSGASASFVNAGVIHASTGRTLTVSGGTFEQAPTGQLNIDGATLSGNSAALAFDADYTIPAAAAATFTTSSVNGPGRIENLGYFGLFDSTCNADLDNAGALRSTACTINGSLYNATGGEISLQCNCPSSTSFAVIANGFTNDGVIRLNSSGAMYGAELDVLTGTLVNGPTGEIVTEGTNNLGTRLNALLDNRGYLNVGDSRGLAIGSGGAHLNSGTITVPGGRYLNVTSGVLTQTAGGQMTIDGALGLTGQTLTLSGGLLGGGGTINGSVDNSGGRVAPGSSAGSLTINGNYTQANPAALEIEVGGPTPGTEFDQLVVSGTASLAGTLQAVPINGYSPAPDLFFQFLTCGTRSGMFGVVLPCNDYVDYTSNGASLAFQHAGPVFNGSSGDLTIQAGEPAYFSAPALNGTVFTYQWHKDGSPISDGPTGSGSTISGATTDQVAITNAQPGDAGSYSVRAESECGFAFSPPAQLMVQGSNCINWQLSDPGGVESPTSRNNHAMVYDSARDVVVLFGGMGVSTNNETWEWDGIRWLQRATTGIRPSARAGHAMAYDENRGITVLFGGTDVNDNTVWEWNGISWSNRPTGLRPAARREHAMAFDIARGVVVMYGGQGGPLALPLRDTWEWNGSAWSRRPDGPAQLHHHSMAYDAARNVTVLYGGVAGTWEWDGSAWASRGVTGPSLRESSAMTFDFDRRVVVLFGGRAPNGDFLGDTWQWDGSTWVEVTAAGPAGRFSHALVYDQSRHTTLLYGGACATERFADLWELGSLSPIVILAAPDATSVSFGATAAFSVAATGDSPTYRWRWNGADLSDGETGRGSIISGATTAALSIANAQFADEGSYDCVVSNACGSQTSAPALLDVNPVSGPRLYLTRTPTDPCVGPGETLTVQLRMSDLGGQTAFGYQAYLSFDAARLQYVSGVYTNTPFGMPLIDPIAVNGGEIDLAAFVDIGGGQGGSSEDALLATLTFSVLNSAGSSSIAFRPHEPPSRIVGSEEEITSTLEDLPPFGVDATPPVLTPPADVTLECTDPTDPAFTGFASATDDGDSDPVVTYTESETAGNCPQSRTLTRHWQASDCAGNVTQADQTITIQDSTPPSITTAAAAQTVECDGAGNTADLNAWLTSNGGAAAEDNCGNIAWTNDFSGLSDDCAATGTVSVTFTATDECGNAATTSATFTIADTTPPSFSTAPADLTLECADAGNDAAIATWLAGAAASDTCGSVAVSHDYSGLMPGACSGTGSAAVTWTATDDCGNTTTHTATVSVVDSRPPTFAAASGGALPGISTIADAGLCTATVSVQTPVVADDCDGTVQVSGTRSDSLAVDDPYPSDEPTTITWTATDCSGNTSDVTQVVNVAAVNEIDVDLVLGGASAPSLVRCIHFEVFPDDCSAPVLIDRNVTFQAGVANGVVLQIPCGLYTCVTARDVKHSLRRTDLDDFGTNPIVGLRYRAAFADHRALGGVDDTLLQGNLHQDGNEYRYIDILDVATLLARFGQSAAADTPCGFAGRHADLNGSGTVDLGDLTIMLANFGHVQDSNCCGLASLQGGNGHGQPQIAEVGDRLEPRESITVNELRAMGLGELEAADLNSDGIVNLDDVAFIRAKDPEDEHVPASPETPGRASRPGR
ncbi:MAG: immunoglobulin domain-containing protein [Phycisphaerales bacterium]|nr:immunoglobulin domain-containing protein [Phycisphaerales bacterium]